MKPSAAYGAVASVVVVCAVAVGELCGVDDAVAAGVCAGTDGVLVADGAGEAVLVALAIAVRVAVAVAVAEAVGVAVTVAGGVARAGLTASRLLHVD